MWRKALRLRAHALRSHRRGAVLIEFAFAMPVMAVIMLGLVDVATCYSAQLSLEQAAGRALERVQVTGATTDFLFVKSEAARAASVSESQVAVDKWLECDNVRQSAATLFCAPGQVPARYLQVTINSTYTPYFRYSPLGTRTANGAVPISASSALRTS